MPHTLGIQAVLKARVSNPQHRSLWRATCPYLRAGVLGAKKLQWHQNPSENTDSIWELSSWPSDSKKNSQNLGFWAQLYFRAFFPHTVVFDVLHLNYDWNSIQVLCSILAKNSLDLPRREALKILPAQNMPLGTTLWEKDFMSHSTKPAFTATCESPSSFLDGAIQIFLLQIGPSWHAGEEGSGLFLAEHFLQDVLLPQLKSL